MPLAVKRVTTALRFVVGTTATIARFMGAAMALFWPGR
jgi:hypothetical protein